MRKILIDIFTFYTSTNMNLSQFANSVSPDEVGPYLGLHHLPFHCHIAWMTRLSTFCRRNFCRLFYCAVRIK